MNAVAKQQQLTATAHHEAGHAFADWCYGFKVKSATIVPNVKEATSGCVVSKIGLRFRSLECTDPRWAEIGRFHGHLVCLLAGYAAQCHHRPSSVRSYHALSDNSQVADLLSRLHAENVVPHVIRYLEATAKNLVKKPRNWFVIECLAAKLLERRTMTGAEITEVIFDGFKRYDASLSD